MDKPDLKFIFFVSGVAGALAFVAFLFVSLFGAGGLLSLG